MYELRNEVEINGTVEQIWEVLTGFAHYAEWNPLIQHVAGALNVRETVVISQHTIGRVHMGLRGCQGRLRARVPVEVPRSGCVALPRSR